MQLKITNPRVVFDLQLNRRVTIIKGRSATGKTWMSDIVSALSDVSFVDCERKVIPAPIIIEGRENTTMPEYNGCVFLIDESSKYALTKRYADAVMNNDIWVVISARTVINYPYSADEVYSIKTSGRVKRLSKFYTECVNHKRYMSNILTEDSGGGNTFLSKMGYHAEPAGGKDNIPNKIRPEMLVIFDKAAIGYVYDILYTGAVISGTLDLAEPESFEWVLLHSDIFNKLPEVSLLLENPEDHGANSYKTWENCFTDVLSKLLSKNQNVNYDKGLLSGCFIEDCCVKSVPCDLYKSGKNKLAKLATVMGIDYLLSESRIEKIKALLPTSIVEEYTDEELLKEFSHII